VLLDEAHRQQEGILLADLLAATEGPAAWADAAAPGAGSGPAPLTADGQVQVVEALLLVLEGLYTHLPLKKARYGVDPVQRLRLLRDRCATMPETDFHTELWQIVTGLRDAHTRYQGAGTFAGRVAVLPFLVEAYGGENDPRYVVSNTGRPELIGDPEFVAGVELLSWSGIPFDRAVARWADNETGGRPDARRARAVETLTLRSLEYGPLPDEQWVIVGYQPPGGQPREVRIPWRVVSPGTASTAVGLGSPGAGADLHAPAAQASLAFNPAAEAVRRAKLLMFAPQAWTATSAEPPARARRTPRAASSGDTVLSSTLPDVLQARVRSTPSGDVGHLRIWSFGVRDDEAFVQEIIRLVDQLPDLGLIIDLRGNPGGLIWAAERALQLFTPHRITPTRFSWLATDVTRALAARPDDPFGISRWAPSLQAALSTGELYSQPLPITEPEACNDLGQRYSGPVLCVVDANTYSAGDLFAAGFADNRIGDIISVGRATGAGGANVWRDALVQEALGGTRHALPALPGGVHFTVSVRRATRTGDADGVPIEDLGVAGTTTYPMTRADLVEDNHDLITWCAQRLAAQPHSGLRVRRTARKLTLTTTGLDRVDLYRDQHPWQTITVRDGDHEITTSNRRGEVEVVGWNGPDILQRRRLMP
jgi:hypothetical protein